MFFGLLFFLVVGVLFLVVCVMFLVDALCFWALGDIFLENPSKSHQNLHDFIVNHSHIAAMLFKRSKHI